MDTYAGIAPYFDQRRKKLIMARIEQNTAALAHSTDSSLVGSSDGLPTKPMSTLPGWQPFSPTNQMKVSVLTDDPTIGHLAEHATLGWGVKIYPSAQILDCSQLAASAVVLLDLGQDEEAELNNLGLLTAAMPSALIIVLSNGQKKSPLYLALASGVCGCLVKPLRPDEISSAVMKVCAGQWAFCPRALQLLFGVLPPVALLGAGTRGEDVFLTETEHEFIYLAGTPFSSKEIALTMRISLRTLDAHRTRVYHKLGVKRRAEAVGKYRTFRRTIAV
jgi:DNA-binding NarL/FixJ family response regulator